MHHKNLVFLMPLCLQSLNYKNVGWTHAKWTKWNNFQISQKTKIENQIRLTFSFYPRIGVEIRELKVSLRKNCPYSEFFCSVFCRIWTEYGKIRSISPYSVQMWENVDKKNSEYGHFPHSAFIHLT